MRRKRAYRLMAVTLTTATSMVLAPGAAPTLPWDPGELSAQQTPPAALDGRVLDAATGQPIEEAYVGADGNAAATLTDGDGAFTLELGPDTAHQLIVSTLGYRPDTLTVRAEDGAFSSLEISLAPMPVELEEIRAEVTSYKRRLDVRRNRSEMRSWVVDREMLRTTDHPHLTDLIRDRFVIRFRGVSDYGCVLAKMGPDWTPVELFVDGRPVTIGQWESIPPDRFERVEIFGGLMSVSQIRAYTPHYLARRSMEGGQPVPLGMSPGLCPKTSGGSDDQRR